MIDWNAPGMRLFPYADDRSEVIVVGVSGDHPAQSTAARALESLRRQNRIANALWISIVVAVAGAVVGVVVAPLFVFWVAVTALVLVAVCLVVSVRHRRNLQATIGQVDHEVGVPVPDEFESTAQEAGDWFVTIRMIYGYIGHSWEYLSQSRSATDPDLRAGKIAHLRQVDTWSLAEIRVRFLNTFHELRQAWLDQDAERWRAAAQKLSLFNELAQIYVRH